MKFDALTSTIIIQSSRHRHYDILELVCNRGSTSSLLRLHVNSSMSEMVVVWHKGKRMGMGLDEIWV